ncbi:MAG: diaminopimelate decarboxylase [Erysipelotrichaceae bacterium]
MTNKILEIGGVPCTNLVKACGTPLYVYDETKLINQFDLYHSYFKSKAFTTEVIYASKAFSCIEMVKLVKQCHASLDVVSGGELQTAKLCNMDMNNVYFHGNNKTEEELAMAFEYSCNIVMDNVMECQRIVSIANKLKKHINLLLRVNPGVEAHTHEYIVTAKLDSKFGISITRDAQLAEIMNLVKSSEYTNFIGFHSHIGSQIFDTEAFKVAIETLVNFTNKMSKAYSINLPVLNIGGGFGVRYTDEDKPLAVKDMCSVLISTLEKELAKNPTTIKKVMIEPGRSIVGEAGYTLYSVGFQKETGHQTYIFVDGGMTDNIRPALYEAKYEACITNKMNMPLNSKVTIAGKCCESGDILVEGIKLPEVVEGDILAFYTTGAYGYSMASNYNRLNKPAVVFAKDGKARIVVKRESIQDQLSNDINEEIAF